MIFQIEPKTAPASDQVVVSKFINRTGIGNQMFEFAAGLSVARHLNLPFQWLWTDNDKRDFGLTHFGIGKPEPRNLHVHCHSLGQGNERTVPHVCRRLREIPDKYLGICSPFQDERCFENVKDEIRELYKLEPMPLDVPEGHTPVAVQVRRGDYVKHPRLDVTSPQYFRRAIASMRGKVGQPWFFIVSDDPAWCRKEFGDMPETTIMPDQSPIDGLRTMVACAAHIISNSSYGWWGAWLGEKGPVITPATWFNKPNSYGDWNPIPARWHRVSTTVPEIFTELPPPGIPRAIVYPWKESDAKWQELRYSLRSVEKFFEDKDCPIFIFGTARPGWILPNSRVKFFSSWTYQDALVRGTQSADTVLWMNDDVLLLKPTTWADVSVPLYLRPVREDFMVQMKDPKNAWQAGVLRALTDLASHGCLAPLIYSTHTPYVYRREQVLDVLRKFGVYHKIPLELILFNLHAENPEQIGDRRVQGVPFGEAQYLNFDNDRLTADLKDAIKTLLPDFAPWELKGSFQV